MKKAFDKKEVSFIILQLIERTRYYYGKKQSAPYARAAKDICIKYKLPENEYFDWLISRGYYKAKDKP